MDLLLSESTMLERVHRDWVHFAGGEPVTVELIGGTVYGFTSELGAYRIEHRYNCRPQVEAAYSTNRGSWFCRLELRFIKARPTGDDYVVTSKGRTAHAANARDAMWDGYELSDDLGGAPATIHCGTMLVATVSADPRTEDACGMHVVGVEFAHDARGREGYALLGSSGNVVAFVHSRPSDAVGVALNRLFSRSAPITLEEARKVIRKGD